MSGMQQAAYMTEAGFSASMFQFLGQTMALIHMSLSRAHKCPAPSHALVSQPESDPNMPVLGDAESEWDEEDFGAVLEKAAKEASCNMFASVDEPLSAKSFSLCKLVFLWLAMRI